MVRSYFACLRLLFVIPNYRLVPNVRFPGQAEDIHNAIIRITEQADTSPLLALSPVIPLEVVMSLSGQRRLYCSAPQNAGMILVISQ